MFHKIFGILCISILTGLQSVFAIDIFFQFWEYVLLFIFEASHTLGEFTSYLVTKVVCRSEHFENSAVNVDYTQEVNSPTCQMKWEEIIV